MSNAENTRPSSHGPRGYQIKIGGRLSEKWAEWFDGLSITHTEHNETLITGLVVDQAALQGLLKKIRDLGLPLLSVNPVELQTPGAGEAGQDPGRPPSSL